MTMTPTYTVPGPSAEGHIGIRMTLGCVLGQETVRVKFLRVRILIRIPVQFVYCQGEIDACWDALIIWPMKIMCS